MSRRKKSAEKDAVDERLLFGALLGLGIVVVVQLISLRRLDRSLTLSLYCFAVSIPLLSMRLVNSLMFTYFEYDVSVWYNRISPLIGGFAALLGLNALFWHFSRIAGFLFGSLCIASLIAFGNYVYKLGKLNLPKLPRG